MAELEALSENPFFAALRGKDHRDIWDNAVERKWLICCPQACSLRGPVTRMDIETHVVRPSNIFPGEFITLNGRTVAIIGEMIETRSGFDEPQVREERNSLHPAAYLRMYRVCACTTSSHHTHVYFVMPHPPPMAPSPTLIRSQPPYPPITHTPHIHPYTHTPLLP